MQQNHTEIESEVGSDPQSLHRFLSVDEVATILRVSAGTIYRVIDSGGIPAVKIRGRYVIPSKAIDQLEMAALSAVPVAIQGIPMQFRTSSALGGVSG